MFSVQGIKVTGLIYITVGVFVKDRGYLGS